MEPSPARRPFDVATAFRRIRKAVAPFPPAALFQLADEGFRSPFEQLLACLISIRTRDEATVVVARALFRRARTPAQLLALSVDELDGVIRGSTFHRAKAAQMLETARVAQERYGGSLPCDAQALTALRGVGPKCAHLVLGIACGVPRVSVDIHVHRVTNRWGYVAEPTPERTMAALEERLPPRYHVEINRLLVPFGKHICTGRLPRCSTCPVLDMCEQVGVERHR